MAPPMTRTNRKVPMSGRANPPSVPFSCLKEKSRQERYINKISLTTPSLASREQPVVLRKSAVVEDDLCLQDFVTEGFEPDVVLLSPGSVFDDEVPVRCHVKVDMCEKKEFNSHFEHVSLTGLPNIFFSTPRFRDELIVSVVACKKRIHFRRVRVLEQLLCVASSVFQGKTYGRDECGALIDYLAGPENTIPKNNIPDDVLDLLHSLIMSNFKTEMFAFGKNLSAGSVKGAIEALPPGGIPVSVGVDSHTSQLLTDFLSKVTNMAESVKEAPIFSGKVEVGLSSVLTPTVIFLLGGALTTWSLTQATNKWVKALTAIVGSMLMVVNVPQILIDSFNKMVRVISQLGSYGVTATEEPVEPGLYNPDDPTTWEANKTCFNVDGSIVHNGVRYDSSGIVDAEVINPVFGAEESKEFKAEGLGIHTVTALATPILTWIHYSLCDAPFPEGGVKAFIATSATAMAIAKGVNFSTQTFLDLVNDVVGFMSNTFGFNVPGAYPWPALEEFEKFVREISLSLRAGGAPTPDLATKLSENKSKLLKVLGRSKPGSTEQRHGYVLLKSLDELISTCDVVYNDLSIRVRPTALWIAGSSGAGKSTALRWLRNSVLSRLLPESELVAFTTNPESYTYDKDATDEFWTNYHGQYCMMYDDAFVVKDLKTGGDKDLTFLIHAVNGATMPLNMAALSDKGTKFFRSQIIFITSNEMRLNSVSMGSYTMPEAFRNRVVGLYFCPAMAYCLPLKEGANGITDRVLDPTKRGNAFDVDSIAVFDLCLRTGKPIAGTERTLRDLANEVVEIHRKAQGVHKALTESINDLLMTESLERPGISAETRAKLAELKEKRVARDDRAVDIAVKLPWLSDVNVKLAKAVKDGVLNVNHTVDECVKYFEAKHSVMGEKALSLLDSSWKFIKDSSPLLMVGAAIAAFTLAWPALSSALSPEGYENTKERRKVSRTAVRRARNFNKHFKADAAKDLKAEGFDPIGVNTVQVIGAVLRKSVYSVHLNDSDVVAHYMLGLGGTTFATTHHMLDTIDSGVEDKNCFFVTLKNPFTQNTAIRFSATEFLTYVSDPYNSGGAYLDVAEDLMYVNLPKSCMNALPNISHLFRDAIPVSPEKDGVIGVVPFPDTNSENMFGMPSVPMWSTGQREYKSEDGEAKYKVTTSWTYKIKSFKGMCGLPCFVVDSRGAHIVGLHVAGNGSGTGLSVALTKPMVEALDLKSVVTRVMPPELNFSDLDLSELCAEMKEVPTGAILGRCTKQFQNVKSNIANSQLHGLFGDIGKSPAMLKRTGGIRPLYNAQANYNRPTTVVNPDLMDDIIGGFTSFLASKGATWDRQLTFEEACDGIEGVYNGLPRATSAGFPSKMRYKGVGKKAVLGNSPDRSVRGPKWDDFVKDYVELKTSIIEDRPIAIVLSDSLKDEVLSNSKVLAGNSRLICGSDMLFMVLLREQYGAYQIAMTQPDKVLFNTTAKGYNPYKGCVTLAELLNRHKSLFGQDYRKFDGGVAVQFINAFFDIMERLGPVKVSEENLKIRAYLRLVSVQSWHMVMGLLVEWTGCISSGHGLTQEMGCTINVMYSLLVLANAELEAANPDHGTYGLVPEGSEDPVMLINYRAGEVDFRHLLEENVIITMGDDLAMSLADRFSHLTSRDFAKTLRYFGVECTNSNKTDPFTNPMGAVSLSELSFLRRTLKKIGGRHYCPLELESIYKALYFTGLDGHLSSFEQNVQLQLFELSMHGRTVFEEHVGPICEAMKEHYSVVLPYTTWRACLNKVEGMESTY